MSSALGTGDVMSPERIELDPGLVGANIAAERKRQSLNQTELARRIGVSRPILVAIESGQRLPPPEMLSSIADVLDVRVRDLAALPTPEENVLVRFRDPLRSEQKASPAVDALINFGRFYILIECKAAKPFRPRSVLPMPLDAVADIDRTAEDLAMAERARLRLGDAPILDVRSLLEQEVGLLTFAIPQLAQTKVAGLFLYALDLPLIGFNPTQADARRARWTIAHEYAHFLTNRYDAEITYEAHDRRSRTRHEAFADAFATHFLMPASAIYRYFSELVGGTGKATVSHILLLAHQFRVSFQAMCERLESMGHIPRDTYAYVMSQGLRPLEAERALGIDRRDEELSPYPARFLYYLSVLWRRGELSEGDVSTYLQVDRLSAREVIANFESEQSYPIDAPLEKVR